MYVVGVEEILRMIRERDSCKLYLTVSLGGLCNAAPRVQMRGRSRMGSLSIRGARTAGPQNLGNLPYLGI
jgi:hypothetical protein